MFGRPMFSWNSSELLDNKTINDIGLEFYFFTGNV